MVKLTERDLHRFIKFSLLCFFIVQASCSDPIHERDLVVFNSIPSRISNIDFSNNLTETDSFNYFLFSYMYMGGGVSVADFNNDGLTDIYFTGNMVRNRLYLNMGNFRFRDVTEISNTGGNGSWRLGSTVCDINNDGLPDIYVSVSGLSDECRNLLFVNQGTNQDGIPIFIEKAESYGIDDNGKSTQGVFFDYDNDMDQDLFVANYPITQFHSPPYFYRQMMKNARMEQSSHLYRNNGNGTFTNVTAESGLLSFGLALSATISDLNQDGFKDIYVSNDFTSPDFYYFNNGDGTFTDKTREVTGQTSFFGMGADIADYNNDGLPDILQIDMAPEDPVRAKENMSSMSVEEFEQMVNEGLHHQYRYNTLQLNRGILKNGLPWFSNAAWIAGVTSTDWSWAGLFADLDLDGWKDIVVTNGSRRDINNIDYFNKIASTGNFNDSPEKSELLKWVKKMPYEPQINYIFRNNGNLSFTHCSKQWGINEKNYSNGAAYADLDNDGDLELIINNIDEKALIYKNNTRENNSGNYLKIDFKGIPYNSMGLGTSVAVWDHGNIQFGELTLSRGYQSSMEPVLYFGLDTIVAVDSLVVTWPDGKYQILRKVMSNQRITLNYPQTGDHYAPALKEKIFREITSDLKLNFAHRENEFNDYEKQALLPYKLSATGPDLCVGDVNNDGLDDFFSGNAANSKSAMFIQQQTGTFVIQHGPWENDSSYEDAGSLLFDADSDGDNDLYVVSGGYEFPENSEQYADRLYLNTGNGIFIKATDALPAITVSGSCVKSLDFDNDDDPDLFIGGRQTPWRYPYPASSRILENITENGHVRFKDVTSSIAPELLNAGMVTSALCTDIDHDNRTDLIIAGEWMPLCIYRNVKGKFEKSIIEGTNGWWFSIAGADFDKDGDTDLVAGNLGLNMRFKASTDMTFDVFANDFDNDGKSDLALTSNWKNNQYPLRSRACYVNQNPGLAEKFPTYGSFAKATISDIYSPSMLSNSLHLQTQTFASCYFENTGNGQFIIEKLPDEAQLSAINDLIIDDIDRDGNLDVVAAGNIFNFEVVTPRNDAGAGIFLKGDGKGSFEVIPPGISGFYAPGDVKSLCLIHLKNAEYQKAIMIGNNNDFIQSFGMNKMKK